MDKAASYVGESGPDTSKALGAIVPTTVAALSNLAATRTGAQQISQALTAGKYDGSILGNVGSLFGNKLSTDNTITAGKGLLDSLFGNSFGSMTDLIARASGIRAGSASSLMALIAPLIMHVLGRQQAAAGGGVSALTNLLGEQRGFLGGLLPSGMASLLGWSGVTSGLSDVASATAGPARRPSVDNQARRTPAPERLQDLRSRGGVQLHAGHVAREHQRYHDPETIRVRQPQLRERRDDAHA